MTSKTLFDTTVLDRKKNPKIYPNEMEVDSVDQPINSKANAIANSEMFGVTHLVDLTIVIEGTECRHFKNFHLNQDIKGHHRFELSLHPNVLGENETHQMVQSQEFLGKRILVRFTFKHSKEKAERDFVGIITEVSFEQSQGNRGDILLSGCSPTILLDKAPNIQSFGGDTPISLQLIASELLEAGYAKKGKFDYVVASEKSIALSYSCQYNETAYNYLARMAEAYGEQFFYDGETLHFGDVPYLEAPLPLVYGRDINHIKISMSAQHVNRELYGYNSLDNERLSATGDTNLSIKGTLAKSAYEKSKRVFTTPSLQSAPLKATNNQEITQAQKGLIGSVGMSVFVISGTTTVPFLYPGCRVELSFFQAETKESEFFTKLMITSIKHEVDSLGQYRGSFEAVDAETGFIPRIAFDEPLVEQQIATVVSNADPQHKGRVQVRFDWQGVDQSSAFIRVLTPDAGSSSVVDKNRGLVTIPEVGDQVLVGFVNQHPDRPIVMGSLFHGAIGAGGGLQNNSKSWSSKSGHIIELNDGGGIKIIDKKKNFIQLDGDGQILMQTSKKMAFQTGKSSLVMEENGKIILEGEELILKGNTITNTAAVRLVEQSGGANLTLDGEGNEANLSSKTTTIDASGSATLNGGSSAKVTAGGVASIEGAMVKLN